MVYFCLALCLLWALVPPVFAEEKGKGENAFSGASLPGDSVIEVAINGLDDVQKDAAMRTALRVTLLRAGVDKNLMSSKTARESLANAAKYMKSLEVREPSEADLVSAIPMTRQVRDTGQVTNIAVITVAGEAIDQLVTRVELELGEARDAQGEVISSPADQSTLVWLLVRDGGREVIVTERSAQSIVARAREIAGVSGHILKFPVGGSMTLTAETLATDNPDVIVAASRRYNSAAVLVGVLDRTDSVSWNGTWQHLGAEEPRKQPLSAQSLDELLTVGLHWYIGMPPDEAPSVTAASSSGKGKGFVWVSTSDSGKAYQRLMSMFQTVVAVTRVFPEELANHGILFSVSPASAVNAIRSSAHSLQWLKSLDSADPSLADSGAPEGAAAYFQYVP